MKKTGRMVRAAIATRKAAIAIVIAWATKKSSVQRRMAMPMRSKSIAISRSTGMTDMVRS